LSVTTHTVVTGMFNRTTKTAPAKISLDLGAWSTRLYCKEHGLLLDEPSTGLLDLDHPQTGARAVTHYGQAAIERFNVDPSGKRLINPLQMDAVNNVGHSPRMLSFFIQKAIKRGLISKSPVILLTVPCDITENSVDQLRKACFSAGTSRVHLVDNGIATGLGAGLTIDRKPPLILIDFGARDSRLYTYSGNEIVASTSVKCGGDSLDQALVTGIRERFGIHISDAAAQDAKHRVGSAMPLSFDQETTISCQVNGLEISTNSHTRFRVSSDSAGVILRPLMQQLASVVAQSLEALPGAVKEVLSDDGIMLTGGGSLLPQMDQLIMEATDLPVAVANRPLTTTVRGGAIMLNRIHGTERKPSVSLTNLEEL